MLDGANSTNPTSYISVPKSANYNSTVFLLTGTTVQIYSNIDADTMTLVGSGGVTIRNGSFSNITKGTYIRAVYNKSTDTWYCSRGDNYTQANGKLETNAAFNLTGVDYDLGSSIYTIPSDGMYQLNLSAELMTPATSSSTMPAINISYTDKNSNTRTMTFGTDNTANDLTAMAHLVVSIYAKAGSTVSYQTTTYATSGATRMTYDFHMDVVKL